MFSHLFKSVILYIKIGKKVDLKFGKKYIEEKKNDQCFLKCDYFYFWWG